MSAVSPYELAAAALLAASGIGVERYRTGNTGVARVVDGKRVIQTPRARGPVSFGVLAHEIGHHALGHVGSNRLPRWVEEVEAWEFALAAVQKFGLGGYDRVYADALKSIGYAFSKALRRGVAPDTIRDRFPAWWNDVLRAELHDLTVGKFAS